MLWLGAQTLVPGVGAARQQGTDHAPPLLLQSQKGAELVYRFPILLDACANEMQRQGDAMMSKWAEVRARRS